MKKNVRALGVALSVLALSAALLVGCANNNSNNSSSSNGTSDGADDKFTLTVGFDQGYPPYGYVGDNGEFTGFDLDLAKAVCDKNGWNLKLEPINWDAKDALLGSGAINCIWNGFTIEGRENDYTFTDPYMLNEQVVVAKSDSGIKTLKDLSGKTVMTQVDSAALSVLEDGQADLSATFGALQTIGDYNNAFMQLESGMVDAVACDLSIAAYQMSAKPDVYVQVDSLSAEHYGVGFAKGETELAQKVTDTLKELDADGTVKKLCEKYADQGISYDNWVL